MLGIQLETLSVVEVRRLLEIARGRGQDGLVRQLEGELVARLGRGPGQSPPMPAAASAEPIRPATPSRQRRRGPAIAVAGLAAFTGAALAWGLSLTPPDAARPQAVAMTTAGPSPRIAVALTTTELPEEASGEPAEAPDAPAPVIEPPREPARSRAENPCLDLATAHERLVCGYPSLAIQDRRMKAALDRARANGSDVKAIEDAQAEWQTRSANVQDRLALADRYAQRIAELESE